MGVLNVTPDSFSDGGMYLDPAQAVAHGEEMIAQGADVVDVGGESTRPGASPVELTEELRRVIPVVEGLAGRVRISIDTTKAEVARAAVAAGATLVNDVSASLSWVAAELEVGWIAMHMAGSPPSMQVDPRYDDVVAEVRCYLVSKATEALRLGVKEVWIDPGFGFGKTVSHNLDLLANIGAFVETGFPVVLGTSRKSTLGVLVAQSDGRVAADSGEVEVRDRLEASIATATWAMTRGVRMVRVHDVRGTVQAAKLVTPSPALP
ncbi:MAG: Dihydropteroate synthase [Acidimicrobiales bacterium]|nr:MAG: dihydropteroate synthase [Actinomycetota bacterium]MBV6508457.1 Dihydropteroate synthase [Acidimicrobiales bacterium]RIK04884.1 MAG: dihydropteroate synthase [Acidobacteriota bacterium]